MPIPTTAPIFPESMDPTDVVDFYISVTEGNDGQSILMPNEGIASYTLGLSPEAALAGLQLLTDARKPVREGKNISLWLSVDPAKRALPVFDGTGLLLGIELTIVTDAIPSRTKQRTFGVRVVNK